MPRNTLNAVAASLVLALLIVGAAIAAPAPPAQPDAPPVAPAPTPSPAPTPAPAPAAPTFTPAPATRSAPSAPAPPPVRAGPTPAELAARARAERQLDSARELAALVRIGNAAADSAAANIDAGGGVLADGLSHVSESLIPTESGGLPGPGLLALFILLVGASGVLAGITALRVLARANPQRLSLDALPNPLHLPTRGWALGSAILLAAALFVGFA